MNGLDAFNLVTGVPLIAIVPVLVELAKRQGLPMRYAGLAAIGLAALLLALANVALGEAMTPAAIARWLLGGVIYGLAAAGLYSQRAVLTRSHPGPAS